MERFVTNSDLFEFLKDKKRKRFRCYKCLAKKILSCSNFKLDEESTHHLVNVFCSTYVARLKRMWSQINCTERCFKRTCKAWLQSNVDWPKYFLTGYLTAPTTPMSYNYVTLSGNELRTVDFLANNYDSFTILQAFAVNYRDFKDSTTFFILLCAAAKIFEREGDRYLNTFDGIIAHIINQTQHMIRFMMLKRNQMRIQREIYNERNLIN